MQVYYLIEVDGDATQDLIIADAETMFFDVYQRFCTYDSEYGTLVAAVTESNQFVRFSGRPRTKPDFESSRRAVINAVRWELLNELGPADESVALNTQLECLAFAARDRWVAKLLDESLVVVAEASREIARLMCLLHSLENPNRLSPHASFPPFSPVIFGPSLMYPAFDLRVLSRREEHGQLCIIEVAMHL